ncbi:MAG: hypothetical protein FWD39_05730, partial [Clostridiales bacterium]|nr:hypothetical protein [Clostridiales bacterium]
RTLADIKLPAGWAWVSITICPTVGNSGYSATYTPADGNYLPVIQTLTQIVLKADPPYTLPDLAPVVYDPNRTLADIKLPAGWAWVDTSIVPGVGDNEFMATFTPGDTQNYNIITAAVPLKVEAAAPVVNKTLYFWLILLLLLIADVELLIACTLSKRKIKRDGEIMREYIKSQQN